MTIRDILNTGKTAAEGLARYAVDREQVHGMPATVAEVMKRIQLEPHSIHNADVVRAGPIQWTESDGGCIPAGFVREHRFHPTRRWRFDYAWLTPRKIALEIEGGAWIRGRHTRGKGYLADMEKYNEAGLMGWPVLRCTPGQFTSGWAGKLVADAMTNGRTNA